MSRHYTALVARPPDVGQILDVMSSVAPDLLVRLSPDGVELQFFEPACDADGAENVAEEANAVLSVEAPMLIAVPGEVTRLLGPDAGRLAPVPPWWIEIRVAEPNAQGESLAQHFGAELVSRIAGLLWPPVDQEK